MVGALRDHQSTSTAGTGRDPAAGQGHRGDVSTDRRRHVPRRRRRRGNYRFSVFGLGVLTSLARACRPRRHDTPGGHRIHARRRWPRRRRRRRPSVASPRASTGTAGATTATTADDHDPGARDGQPFPATTAAWPGWGSHGGPTARPSEHPGSAPRYVAVVAIDADTRTQRRRLHEPGRQRLPRDILHTAASASPTSSCRCRGTSVGPASTAVRVTVPACGAYFGWTEVPGAGTAVGAGGGPASL